MRAFHQDKKLLTTIFIIKQMSFFKTNISIVCVTVDTVHYLLPRDLQRLIPDCVLSVDTCQFIYFLFYLFIILHIFIHLFYQMSSLIY